MDHPLCRRARLWAALAVASALAAPRLASAERMSFQHTPPPSGRAGKSLEVVGTIFGASDLARARCRYRQRGGAWKQVELGLEHGDVYRAIIPGSDVLPPSLEYYCIAFDFFGGQMELYGSASSPRRVKVTGEIRVRAERPAAEDPAPAEKDPEGVPPERPGKVEPRDTGKIVEVRTGDGAPEAQTGPRRPPEPAPEPPAEDEEEEGDGEAESEEDASVRSAKDEELALFGAEDVVTLATRQAQSVIDAPAIATGVPDEQMRSLGLRMLPEVLKLVPGFETSRDVQGFWRVAVRGMRDESALLVLYNGHRLNNAYDSRSPLAIPTENVERVEAMRGPGSALYGAGAFLGVVNVVPKRRETLEGAVSGGSFGTLDGHLSAGHRFGSSFLLFADGDFSRSDGYRAAIGRDGASAAMIKAGRAEDAPAGLTNDRSMLANAGVEARYAPAGGAQTRLSLRYLHEDRGALVGLFDTLGRDSRLKWHVFLADLTEEVPFSSGAFSAHLYFDHQIVDRLFQIAPAGYLLGGKVAADGLFERTQFTSQTVGFDASIELSIAQAHKLTLGLAGEMDRLPTYSYELNFEGTTLLQGLRAPTGFRANQDLSEINQRLIGGVFAQYVWRIVESLSLTLGMRVDLTQLPEVETDPVTGETTAISGTKLVPSYNPRLGLVWAPLPGWSFKLLYGRAFRAPTMQELSEQLPINDFNQGRFEGNPGLRPVIIDTVEAGAEAATAVGENKVRVRANGFFNNFKDPIMQVDTTGNVIPLQNRELGVRVFGAEAEVRFEVSSRAYTFLNYSWFRASDLAAPEGFEHLTDVPQYRLNWAVTIPLGRWIDFAVLAQAGAERRNNGRSKLEVLRHYKIPAYVLFGAQLKTQPLGDHVDVALGAQNVFNYGLQDDVPRPDQGRMSGLLPREGFGAYLTVRARL